MPSPSPSASLSSSLPSSSPPTSAAAPSRNTNPNPNGGGIGGNSNDIMLPRIIFITEDDNNENNNSEECGRGSTSMGLDLAAINSYPRFSFFTAKDCDAGAPSTSRSSGRGRCFVPDCHHYFHLPCIDEWLRLNTSCPVCCNSLMPTSVSTSLSTPLFELILLSHFAADRRRK